jgi:septal ring factor EnvC (AmiA/AmiB activator)
VFTIKALWLEILKLYVHRAMRSERNDVEREITRTETRRNSLVSEIATLQSQKDSLERSTTMAQSLWTKSESIASTSAPLKELTNQKMHEYQALKEATDDFAQWTASAHGHTETMVTLCGTEASLRKMTKRMLESLLNADHSTVKAVCAPLKHLSISE